MDDWTKKICNMAIDHVKEEVESVNVEGDAACFIIESEENKDGGITHNVTFRIGKNVFDVEVYEKNNILEDADCWRINGDIGKLVLEKH